MASHNEYSFPKEYRHYLAELLCKNGIADYTEQIRKLAEVCEVLPIMQGALWQAKEISAGQEQAMD